MATSLTRDADRERAMEEALLPNPNTTVSYGAAVRELGLSARHEQGQRRNNRDEASHQPTRRRERTMQRFKSPGSAQRFVSPHAAVYNTLNVERHLISRKTLKVFRAAALEQWRDATGTAA